MQTHRFHSVRREMLEPLDRDSHSVLPGSVRTGRLIRATLALLMLACAVALASTARSEAPESTPAPKSTDRAIILVNPGIPDVMPDAPSPPARVLAPRPRTPMDVELAQARDRAREGLAALQARFRAAAGDRAALAVQREIDQFKRDTEISLLRIQATWARKTGRTAAAAEIEAAIESILHPRIPVATSRPARAPDASSNRSGDSAGR